MVDEEINDLELSVVAPKFDNSGNKIDPGEIRGVAEKFSEEFGGVSINPSELGCWKTDDKGLICEENLRISTTLDTEDPDSPTRARAESIVRKQAREMGEELGQAAIMKSTERTEVDFVEGEWKESISEEKHHDVFDRVL